MGKETADTRTPQLSEDETETVAENPTDIGLEASSGSVLRRVPESSVLLEFVGCPYQPDKIANATTDSDPPRPVVPPKGQCEYGEGHGSDNRIDKEYLMFVRTKINGF